MNKRKENIFHANSVKDISKVKENEPSTTREKRIQLELMQPINISKTDKLSEFEWSTEDIATSEIIIAR